MLIAVRGDRKMMRMVVDNSKMDHDTADAADAGDEEVSAIS